MQTETPARRARLIERRPVAISPDIRLEQAVAIADTAPTYERAAPMVHAFTVKLQTGDFVLRTEDAPSPDELAETARVLVNAAVDFFHAHTADEYGQRTTVFRIAGIIKPAMRDLAKSEAQLADFTTQVREIVSAGTFGDEINAQEMSRAIEMVEQARARFDLAAERFRALYAAAIDAIGGTRSVAHETLARAMSFADRNTVSETDRSETINALAGLLGLDVATGDVALAAAESKSAGSGRKAKHSD